MMPPQGFLTPPQIINITTSERPLATTTVFAATTPENTPFLYHASTSTNPNPTISPAFIEANYEILEYLLRERRRQIRNEDLRIKLEYFSEDYDEEREIGPWPEPHREATLTLRLRSLGVRRQRERVIGFEDAPNRPRLVIPQLGAPSPIILKEGIYHRLLPTIAYLHTMGLCILQLLLQIEDYPLSDELKMPSHIGSYDEKGDLDNFLHLFEGAIRMQKWLMPIACHMFTYTLKDSARIWWNSQKVGSILSYEDMKAMFRSHFSQQKKFTKTHLAVHNIKQREGKSTRAFITRYTDDTLQFLDLPSNYKGLMEKAYTWVKAREMATNDILNNIGTILKD
ncbi:reverse transcriptase domain-containing protein [Tanacetum coccineum]